MCQRTYPLLSVTASTYFPAPFWVVIFRAEKGERGWQKSGESEGGRWRLRWRLMSSPGLSFSLSLFLLDWNEGKSSRTKSCVLQRKTDVKALCKLLKHTHHLIIIIVILWKLYIWTRQSFTLRGKPQLTITILFTEESGLNFTKSISSLCYILKIRSMCFF